MATDDVSRGRHWAPSTELINTDRIVIVFTNMSQCRDFDCMSIGLYIYLTAAQCGLRGCKNRAHSVS